MRNTLVVLAVVAVLGGCAEPAQTIDTLRPAALQDRLDKATAEVPGVAFGAVLSDGTTLIRTSGMADLASARPVTADTSFAWFSVTKLFTAAAVLQLSERGLIDLDASAERYLPGMRLEKDGRKATVRHLLSHTAGIPNPIPVTWIHPAAEPGPAAEAMIRQRLGGEPTLDFVPGTKVAYSNLGYLLLGAIIERVSDEPYTTYVERHVLVPLGCRGAGFAVPADRATGYQKKWSLTGLLSRTMNDGKYFGPSRQGYWPLAPFTVDGAAYGGLSGPVDCLLRFAGMTLNGGEGEMGRVLSAASVTAMLTPTRLADDARGAFGLAWQIGTVSGEPYADHAGGGGGYVAQLRVYPRLRYAVAVLGNETSFPAEGFVRIRIDLAQAEPLSR